LSITEADTEDDMRQSKEITAILLSSAVIIGLILMSCSSDQGSGPTQETWLSNVYPPDNAELCEDVTLRGTIEFVGKKSPEVEDVKFRFQDLEYTADFDGEDWIVNLGYIPTGAYSWYVDIWSDVGFSSWGPFSFTVDCEIPFIEITAPANSWSEEICGSYTFIVEVMDR
jgi:hypothetical protein